LDKGLEFQAFIAGCLDSLHNDAMLLARPPEDYEDLLQQSLLKAFNGFETFDRDLPFKAWVFAIIFRPTSSVCLLGRPKTGSGSAWTSKSACRI